MNISRKKTVALQGELQPHRGGADNSGAGKGEQGEGRGAEVDAPPVHAREGQTGNAPLCAQQVAVARVRRPDTRRARRLDTHKRYRVGEFNTGHSPRCGLGSGEGAEMQLPPLAAAAAAARTTTRVSAHPAAAAVPDVRLPPPRALVLHRGKMTVCGMSDTKVIEPVQPFRSSLHTKTHTHICTSCSPPCNHTQQQNVCDLLPSLLS